ncbi:right-handed parallel beta-helix repeat-containing protein [Burkholderia territorii]|uniref:right-handed parallel beta-helix repeat-containing protein n=1 Tax=Burkholderia territorii TaxID=1503055 RepID=UPI000ADA1186|nr:right-handed parallel beta-helix repeat-containing protein [Burkholderia territorii]
MLNKFMILCAILIACMPLASCGGDGGSVSINGSTTPKTIEISGTLNGLVSGGDLEVIDNAGNKNILKKNGSFTLSSIGVKSGGSYALSISRQPTGQTCAVANGNISNVNGAIENIKVTCSIIAYAIRGDISGLDSGKQVIIFNSSTNERVTISTQGAFAFKIPVPQNGSYSVSVLVQPSGQICTLANGTGSGYGVVSDVNDIKLTCSATIYRISGRLNGLASGQQVTLLNNGGDALTLVANGNFAFVTPVAYNGSYDVIVSAQPIGQTCSVVDGAGTSIISDIGNVQITCSTTGYPIGGRLEGMANGQQVTLLNNGNDPLTLTANGNFTFATPVAYLGSYNVTIGTQPNGQNCVVTSNGSGSGVKSAVTDVVMTCYTIIENGISISNIKDQSISGFQISNPNGPCISIAKSININISGNIIGPCASSAAGVGIAASQSSSLKIINNIFKDVSSAVYATSSTNGNLLIEGNVASKVRGPMPRGQFAQLNNYSGKNIVIRCNVSDQAIGGYGAGPEDHINIFQSSGTADSPILILNNKIRGGGSLSGGGILAGDGAGGGYTSITENILVEPGQYGVAIASGSNMKINNNLIYGAKHSWANVGIYAWSQGSPTPVCSGISVSGNRVNYINSNGATSSWWNGGNCGSIAMTPANVWGDTALSGSVWDTQFPACLTSWASSLF